MVEFGPRAAVGLSVDFVASYLDIIRRRAADDSERINLTVATLVCISYRAAPWFLSMILAACAPRLHRGLIELGKTVARRLRGREGS